MTSHTPHPYFQFVRSVLKAARRRMGQETGKHDVLDLAFHTWAVRCPTENPDRVTEAALNQCVDRHLMSLLEATPARIVIAMGGTLARYLWWRSSGSWDGSTSMTGLHGRVLEIRRDRDSLPAILSLHPYQRAVDLHPEVIGRALGDRLGRETLEPTELKAA